MSNYIYDNTALFFPKTNLAPVPGGGDPTKYVQDIDWNTLNQAVTDIKGVLRGAAWYGLDDQVADPSPSGIGSYLWLSSTGALTLKNGLTSSTFLLSSRTISTGPGLTGGGDLSANRTISLGTIPVGTATDATQGSVFFAGTSGALAQNNTAFFWNNTNKVLKITQSAADPADGTGAITLKNSLSTSLVQISWLHSDGTFIGCLGHSNLGGIVDGLYLDIESSTSRGLVVKSTNGNHFQIFSGSVNGAGLQMWPGSNTVVSDAGTGRIRYITAGQKFQISANAGAYSDIVTRDYTSVERKSADGVADPTVEVTFVSGTGTDLTLAAGPKDGFIKTFVITAGTGTVIPAALANGDVLTWSSAPANVRVIWDATGATWHVVGTPHNVVVS